MHAQKTMAMQAEPEAPEVQGVREVLVAPEVLAALVAPLAAAITMVNRYTKALMGVATISIATEIKHTLQDRSATVDGVH